MEQAKIENAYRQLALIGRGRAGRLWVAFVGSATHGAFPWVIKAYRLALLVPCKPSFEDIEVKSYPAFQGRTVFVGR